MQYWTQKIVKHLWGWNIIINGFLEAYHMSIGQAVISLVLGLMLATFEGVSAMDWMFYARSDFGLYQYDAEEDSHLSNNGSSSK